MIEQELKKDRSVARCMVDGYRLFVSQQLTILRRTWRPIIATSAGLALTVTMSLTAHWFCAVAVLLLTLVSLCYLYRVTLSMTAPLPKTGIALKRILRNLGRFLAFSVLSGLLCVVIFVLLLIPAFVLLAAGHVDHTLMAQGDPEVLGIGFWIQTAITLTVCFALALYAQSWQTLGLAYVYGAMVARDEARQTHRRLAHTTRQTHDGN